MPDQLDLEAIKAYCAKATPGSWVVTGGEIENPHTYATVIGQEDRGSNAWHADMRLILADTDADFIAHARTDLPALVAEVERLREDRDSWEGALDAQLDKNIAMAAECSSLRARVKELEEKYSECDADAHQMATKLTLIREALDG